MKLGNIVWTAVIALGLGVATIVSALAGEEVLTLGLGLSAVTSALLSARERN
jgi:hypothetical protein